MDMRSVSENWVHFVACRVFLHESVIFSDISFFTRQTMTSNVMENDEMSLVDVLDEDNELEAEANAVLGDSDDQNCTYDKGYVNRQALYACLTCMPAAPEVELAGVCLACSFSCHDGHELVELYTKRNFRCDCGNQKFGDFKCNLVQNKERRNEQNKYNQNFKGVYCSCSRPYPDSEDEVEDEMIQCIICEDWFHSRHLSNLPPVDGEYNEMICDQCMEKFSFLCAYAKYSVPSQQICIIKKSETDSAVDVENTKAADSRAFPKNEAELVGSESKPKIDVKTEEEDPAKRKLSNLSCSEEGERSAKKICSGKDEGTSTCTKNQNGGSPDDCVYKKLLGDTQKKHGCTYWKSGWRSQLCMCDACRQMYKDLDVAFLLDKSDTIIAYEDRGKAHREQTNSYDSGLTVLGSLDRAQQMEILHGYNDMKSELTNFLAVFAKEGKTVKEEDIKSFFQNLQNKKKNSSGNYQHFCR